VTINSARWSVGSAFVFKLPPGINFPTVLAPAATPSITISVVACTATGVFIDYLAVVTKDNVPKQLVTGFQVRVY